MRQSRSRVHMVNVLAARVEIDNGPKTLVDALHLVAKDTTIRRAEHRDWSEAEERRVERQRTLFAMLPSCDAVDRLRDAMLQRAYDLMWDGDGVGCDAISEFLPSAAVEKMFSAWSDDFDGKQPYSQFYEARR